MKVKVLYVLPVLLISCSSPDNSLIKIDPENLESNKISLSDVADDITYVALDNNYPMSIFYKVEILNDTIYLSERNNGVIALNNDGVLIRKYRNRGRGPGEYIHGMKFTIDESSGTVYVLDRNRILEYSRSGTFIGEITLGKYGAEDFSLKESEVFFQDIEFFNQKLFVFEYVLSGKAKYNWIVIESSGNLMKQKFNSVPQFKSIHGGIGGIFKHGDKLSYWNQYNDTLFSISTDLSYEASFLFSQGDYREPRHNYEMSRMGDYMLYTFIFETDQFLFLRYFYKEAVLAVIDKKCGKSYKSTWKEGDGGLVNDLDGGPVFEPKYYYEKNGREYMVGYSQPLSIKSRVNSDDFSNSVPKYPEKKRNLINLAAGLKETDNLVLTIVRFKKNSTTP